MKRYYVCEAGVELFQVRLEECANGGTGCRGVSVNASESSYRVDCRVLLFEHREDAENLAAVLNLGMSLREKIS